MAARDSSKQQVVARSEVKNAPICGADVVAKRRANIDRIMDGRRARLAQRDNRDGFWHELASTDPRT